MAKDGIVDAVTAFYIRAIFAQGVFMMTSYVLIAKLLQDSRAGVARSTCAGIFASTMAFARLTTRRPSPLANVKVDSPVIGVN